MGPFFLEELQASGKWIMQKNAGLVRQERGIGTCQLDQWKSRLIWRLQDHHENWGHSPGHRPC